MTLLAPVRTLQFVVKISKYCNLRCTYCYEFRELGKKTRMSLDQLRRMFENIASSEAVKGLSHVNFIWHGGEPFLIPLEYYDQILALQHEVFGGRVQFSNVVQTNLTVLTDRHIEYLKSRRMFRGLGVSFDVFGGQRVDTQGKLRSDVIMRNMQQLIDHRIRFGAIAVLGRHTLPHVGRIYRFYDRLRVESRVLPFYMSAFGDQVSEHALSYGEITTAMNTLFDAWIASANATAVDPIDEYLGYAISYVSGSPKTRYNKRSQENVLIVDLDGSTWGLAEAYDAQYRLGGLFEDNLDDVLGSSAHERTLREAEARIEAHCTTCPYFGHCPGQYVADSTAEQQHMLETDGCPVRGVLDHIVIRLRNADIADKLAHAKRLINNAALDVAV